MKNLHVLPTDKPSRLYKIENKLGLLEEPNRNFLAKNQHIYITSDEEIKDGDYGLSKLNEIVKFHSGYDYRYYAKIILTTGQDLIKDGVQAIDDEFLEWFTKNPSCEEIKVELHEVSFVVPDNIYKIIIPKEEPKHNCRYSKAMNQPYPRLCVDCGKEEPKQETLEESAKRTYQKGLQDDIDLSFHDGVKFGAEWQAERMYSEEEVIKAYHDAYHKGYRVGQKDAESHPLALTIANNIHIDRNKWFEQFKKK
jgi:hypothetical protein